LLLAKVARELLDEQVGGFSLFLAVFLREERSVSRSESISKYTC